MWWLNAILCVCVLVVQASFVWHFDNKHVAEFTMRLWRPIKTQVLSVTLRSRFSGQNVQPLLITAENHWHQNFRMFGILATLF